VEKSKLTVKPESNFGRQIMKNISHAQWTRIENRHGGGVPVQDTRSKVIKLYSGDKGRELAKQGFNYEKSIAVIDPPTDWQILNNFLFS
jgi:hypothetical protein